MNKDIRDLLYKKKDELTDTMDNIIDNVIASLNNITRNATTAINNINSVADKAMNDIDCVTRNVIKSNVTCDANMLSKKDNIEHNACVTLNNDIKSIIETSIDDIGHISAIAVKNIKDSLDEFNKNCTTPAALVKLSTISAAPVTPIKPPRVSAAPASTLPQAACAALVKPSTISAAPVTPIKPSTVSASNTNLTSATHAACGSVEAGDIYTNLTSTTHAACGSVEAGSAMLTDTADNNMLIDEIEEQNKLLKETKTCKVCCEKNVSIVFSPCGHLLLCKDCAANIDYCIAVSCREKIQGTFEIIVKRQNVIH